MGEISAGSALFIRSSINVMVTLLHDHIHWGNLDIWHLTLPMDKF